MRRFLILRFPYVHPDKRSGLEPNSEPNCKLLQKTVEEWHLEAILFCNIFDWVWHGMAQK